MKNIYGEEYKGESTFIAKCRKLQSIYRVEIGEKIRPYKGRDGQVHYYGNYINNGEKPDAEKKCWKNFLTEYAFDYATKRTNPQNKKTRETIEKDRLFNNLLSSQPMAFNLFCPLRQMFEESPEKATGIIKAALPKYNIHKVTDIDLEFIPENYKELSGDKSAMDAIIKFEKADGGKGFIAIETKYSENLGTNVAYDKDENGNNIPRQQSIKAIRNLQCFNPEIEEKINTGKIRLTQIYRNFLLSETYGVYKDYDSHSIVLAHKEHPSTKREVASLSDALREEYKMKIADVSLEDFIAVIAANSPEKYKVIFERFYDRYLNFDKLNNID